MSYQERKAAAREKALDWQMDFANHDYSWMKLAEFSAYFEKLGKRYGLTEEFRENGIL